jgi:hypothetical protein
MAKVGLVWAVAVLGALFMTTSAQGQRDNAYALPYASVASHSAAFAVTPSDTPRTAGLALALVVLGGGAIVLAVGASRGQRVVHHEYAAEPEPVSDLPLALGLGLLA